MCLSHLMQLCFPQPQVKSTSFFFFFDNVLSGAGPQRTRLASTPPCHSVAAGRRVLCVAEHNVDAIRLQSQVMDFTLSHPTPHPNCTQEATGRVCVCVFCVDDIMVNHRLDSVTSVKHVCMHTKTDCDKPTV